MPADLFSTLILILLNAAATLGRVAPYVAGGLIAAALLSRVFQKRFPILPRRWPQTLAAPLAAAMGVVSPLPTAGAVPLVLGLHADGLPIGLALTFVLASSLLNPQLFILTLGALGARFALAQLVSVLVLSIGLGWVLGRDRGNRCTVFHDRLSSSENSRSQLMHLAEHVVWYVLLGVMVGVCLQVLLPRLGLLAWLGERGWLSAPLLGWLGAPFYTCGGSAVPLAGSLAQIGFSPGALFTFLLVGPALRGTTWANLACLLSKRGLATCLIALALAGGALGHAFDWLVSAM